MTIQGKDSLIGPAALSSEEAERLRMEGTAAAEECRLKSQKIVGLASERDRVRLVETQLLARQGSLREWLTQTTATSSNIAVELKSARDSLVLATKERAAAVDTMDSQEKAIGVRGIDPEKAVVAFQTADQSLEGLKEQFMELKAKEAAGAVALGTANKFFQQHKKQFNAHSSAASPSVTKKGTWGEQIARQGS